MEIHHQFTAIELGVAEIKSEVAKTEEALDEAKQILASIAAVWGGSGSQAYQEVQQAWDRTSAELNAALQSLAVAISRSNTRMMSTETALVNMFA